VSAIEWTDRTWNPCVGCEKVSAGCKNCYAERQAYRVALMEHAQGRRSVYLDVIRGEEEAAEGHWNGRAKFLPERLAQPLKWRKPCRVFVNSMSDLFHDDITFEQIAAVFGVMAATPRHTYQVLTKRPARMLEFFGWVNKAAENDGLRISERQWIAEAALAAFVHRRADPESWDEPGDLNGPWPLPNVHIGVSVEDQKAADERIPLLLETDAALRFLSVEPLLGPVDLTHLDADAAGSKRLCQVDALTGRHTDMGRPCRRVGAIGWVIVGGESGPGARVCDLDWIREVVRQCRVAGVPCFVKQLGAAASDAKNGIAGAALVVPAYLLDRVSKRLRDRKGGDMSEWPESLKVRQFPLDDVRKASPGDRHRLREIMEDDQP